jgi:hypothetical protein
MKRSQDRFDGWWVYCSAANRAESALARALALFPDEEWRVADKLCGQVWSYGYGAKVAIDQLDRLIGVPETERLASYCQLRLRARSRSGIWSKRKLRREALAMLRSV